MDQTRYNPIFPWRVCARTSGYVPAPAPIEYSPGPAVAQAPPVRTNPPTDPVVAALAAMRPDMDMHDFRRLNGFRDGCDYYANATNTVYLCYVRHAKDKSDAIELKGASRRRADSNESCSERSAERLEDISSQTWRVERLIEMNKPRT